MREENPERETIERAEDLILRLRDVQSCKIYTDETGKITEIHVVAASDRQPKMIARDVETCLKAELGLWIDFRTIGVVLIDPPKESGPVKHREIEDTDALVDKIFPTDPGLETKRPVPVEPLDAVAGDTVPGAAGKAGRAEPRLDFLEQDMRVRFKGLSLNLEENRVDVEVRLERSGLEVVGSSGDVRKSGPFYEVIAGATLHALMELLDENFHLCLSGIEEVKVLGQDALLAVVDQVEGRAVRSFTGCVFTGRDPNEAAVLAVLDALNRALGKWKSRKEVHYRIR